MAVDTAAGLAYVCSHLPELRGLLGDDGSESGTPLGRLLAACGGSRPAADIAPLLGEVDAALRALTDGMVGVQGFGEGRGTSWSGLEPLEYVYRCPLGRCTGRLGSEVAEVRPLCAISRRELVRERLL